MGLFKKKPTEMSVMELMDKGRESIKKKKYEDGIKYLSILVERHPEHLDGRILLANCYLSLNQFNQVYNQCEAMLEVDPDFGIAYFSYGLALIRSGQVDEGMVKMKRAAELSPENEDIQQSYKRLYYAGRQLDIAGWGERHRKKRDGGLLMINVTEFLTEIATKCIEEDKVVPVISVSHELLIGVDNLDMFLDSVADNIDIHWKILKLGRNDYLFFEKL